MRNNDDNKETYCILSVIHGVFSTVIYTSRIRISTLTILPSLLPVSHQRLYPIEHMVIKSSSLYFFRTDIGENSISSSKQGIRYFFGILVYLDEFNKPILTRLKPFC